MKKIALTFLVIIALDGCIYTGGKEKSTGPVHPTDEQINSSTPGETDKTPYPYTPWWVEMGFN